MDESYCSNETSESILKSDTLDELYKQQVSELRNLILRNTDASNIEMSRKWLKVFNRTSKTEKLARNCLCTLMGQQLKELGCLSEPFTNLSNCNRDLECVLRELDNETLISTFSFRSESNATAHNNTEGVIRMEYSQNELEAEIERMQHEIENLRTQLTEKQKENEKLKEVVDKYHRECEDKKQILNNMKVNILNCIRDKLFELGSRGVIKNSWEIFESTLQIHSSDLEFMSSLRKYDLELQQILGKYLECELSKSKATIISKLCRKFLKQKSSLRQKYERRLTMQSMTQKLQIKLAKLKCISELRQIFIRSHSEFEKIELWEILNMLEEKYDSVVNGL